MTVTDTSQEVGASNVIMLMLMASFPFWDFDAMGFSVWHDRLIFAITDCSPLCYVCSVTISPTWSIHPLCLEAELHSFCFC